MTDILMNTDIMYDQPLLCIYQIVGLRSRDSDYYIAYQQATLAYTASSVILTVACIIVSSSSVAKHKLILSTLSLRVRMLVEITSASSSLFGVHGGLQQKVSQYSFSNSNELQIMQ